jgi:ferredoxin-NADP reductase
LNWIEAEVIEVIPETADVKSIGLACPGWPGHLPGQHVDIRLTAEDGYQAERSYSIANPVDGEKVVLTVERVANGEVSPYLLEELTIGDRIELRGPIGGYFVWRPEHGGPLQLLAGGSGIVPLMAIVRALNSADDAIPTRMLISARSWESVIYRAELEAAAQDNPVLAVAYTLTRSQPSGWKGFSRRVDRAMLQEFSWPVTANPLVFICGPTGFVEASAANLVDLGHDPLRIRTERFGPSGG